MAAAYVNNGDGFNTASGGSIATAATSHTTGNLLVCCVRHEGATTTISISDTAGNTWTPLTKVTHPGGDMHLQLFYVLNCTGNASNVVTATFGANRTFRGIQVQQFSGLNTYDEEDSGTTTAGTSVTAGTVNIDGAGVVVNGIALYGGLLTWSASTGYTLVQNSADTQRMGMSYELETGSSAESPGASGSSNDDWIIVSSAFLEAGAGPTIDTQPASQTCYEGQTATFTISATTSGGTLSYQWKDDGSNVGTNSNSYTTAAAVYSTDNGAQITCAVTDDNGTTTSNAATWAVAIAAKPFYIKA